MRITVPVEVKSRDFLGCLWLSVNLLEKGHEVVLGETASVRNSIDLIQSDVYIRPGLSESSRKSNICKQVQDAGGSVVIIGTEDGVLSEEQFKSKYSPNEMLEHIDVYFTWGSKQAKMLSERTNLSEEKITISGHPRFDLLSPNLRGIYQNQADQLNYKYGKYILINTNFTCANNSTRSSSEFSKQIVEYQSKISQKYLSLAKRLSKDLEEHSIIVRPHPVEDVSFYRDHLSKYENIYTIRKGEVRPWILGADAVIHKSSTSGIESALLETPVISYRPFKMDEQDKELPIIISDEQTDYNNLHMSIVDYIDGGRSYTLNPEQSEILKRYFHNIENVSATDIIVETIDSLVISETDDVLEHDLSLKQTVKRYGNKYIGSKATERAGEIIIGSDFSNTRQKVPKISRKEIVQNLDILNEYSNRSTRQIQIEPIQKLANTFLLKCRE